METFYRFLGGPRTFWGGSNRVVINNYGCGPMFGGMCRPVFFNNNCFGGGLNNMLGIMAGMNLLSNIFGYSNQMANPYMGYQPGMYQPYAPQQYQLASYNSLASRISSLTKEVDSLQKQIDDIENAKCDCADNNSSTDKTDNTGKTDKTDKTGTTDTTGKTDSTSTANEAAKTDKTDNANKTDTTQNTTNTGDDGQLTFDDLLNTVEGYDKLNADEKSYVKSHIAGSYKDQNGNQRYNIRAIVHDGDTLDTIINRFYNEQEKQELNVAENEYNAQVSGKKVKNPNSGDTIYANGVSEFGIKSLMEDAKQTITKEGEIQKTNKKLSELKESFVKGDKKLSKEYVLQNHLMSETEYNNIIQNKYQQ